MTVAEVAAVVGRASGLGTSPMDDDRPNILRCRPDGADADEYIPVVRFDIEQYECGLHAGDRLRLIRDLPIFGEDGKPTGEFQRKGEIWIVLTGSSQDPGTPWLRQPDGQFHSWDDDSGIFNDFRKIYAGD